MLLIWLAACALVTKQADFDVDLPIFGSDDGTAVAPESIPLDVKLYDSRKEWTLPTYLEVEDWGAILLADSALRDSGAEGLLAVEVSVLSLEADPGFIDLTVTLTSLDDRRYLLDDATAITTPAACTFRIDESSTTDTLSDGMLGCLEAWTDANGAPPNPSVTITVSDTNLERFTFAAELGFATARTTEILCSGRLGVNDEMREEADNIELQSLELAGYVASLSGPMDLVAFQNTYPQETGDPVGGGHTVVALEGLGGTFVGQETAVDDALPAGVTLTGVAPISYFPDREDWLSGSIAALETDEGYIEACWVAAHSEPTGEAFVRFKLVGDGHYDGREN